MLWVWVSHGPSVGSGSDLVTLLDLAVVWVGSGTVGIILFAWASIILLFEVEEIVTAETWVGSIAVGITLWAWASLGFSKAVLWVLLHAALVGGWAWALVALEVKEKDDGWLLAVLWIGGGTVNVIGWAWALVCLLAVSWVGTSAGAVILLAWAGLLVGGGVEVEEAGWAESWVGSIAAGVTGWAWALGAWLLEWHVAILLSVLLSAFDIMRLARAGFLITIEVHKLLSFAHSWVGGIALSIVSWAWAVGVLWHFLSAELRTILLSASHIVSLAWAGLGINSELHKIILSFSSLELHEIVLSFSSLELHKIVLSLSSLELHEVILSFSSVSELHKVIFLLLGDAVTWVGGIAFSVILWAWALGGGKNAELSSVLLSAFPITSLAWAGLGVIKV